MRKLTIIASFMFLSVFLIFPVNTSALSPGPAVYECWEEEKSDSLSSRCAKVLCEWNNVERNWPSDTGYYEDCSEYKNINKTYVVTGVLIASVVIGAVIIIVGLHNHKKSK